MTTAAPWQQGFDLALLKHTAEIFARYERGLVFGQFGGVSERQVAEWLAADELHTVGDVLVHAHRSKMRLSITDFRGEIACRIPAGVLVLDRWACNRAAYGDLAAELAELQHAIRSVTHGATDFWLVSWPERAADRALVRLLGAYWRATKIAASSEIRQVSSAGLDDLLERSGRDPYEAVEQLGLARLRLRPSHESVAVAAAAVAEHVPRWEQHYSGYNKGGSWTAVALRGFSPDPAFIEKPAEMSKRWKAEHAESLSWPLQWTPLWSALEPALRPLIDALPCGWERLRLMRLAPGGGELTRHADITNRDAGLQLGQLARLHLPLVTNPDVVFQSWGLQGERRTAQMDVGEWWYLDQRKPHTAKNGGASWRIHLVGDAIVTPALRQMLEQAA